MNAEADADGHGLRTAWLTGLLCVPLCLPDDQSQAIVQAAYTHDIGKQFVDEMILAKPRALARDERDRMEQHAALGAWLLMNQGHGDPDAKSVDVAVALSHHEWWNGLGYPFGLAGRAIPQCARIVAVADVFDALVSVRPYKPAWSQANALDYIERGRGKQFDPECVDALIQVASTLPVAWQEMAQAMGADSFYDMPPRRRAGGRVHRESRSTLSWTGAARA